MFAVEIRRVQLQTQEHVTLVCWFGTSFAGSGNLQSVTSSLTCCNQLNGHWPSDFSIIGRSLWRIGNCPGRRAPPAPLMGGPISLIRPAGYTEASMGLVEEASLPLKHLLGRCSYRRCEMFSAMWGTRPYGAHLICVAGFCSPTFEQLKDIKGRQAGILYCIGCSARVFFRHKEPPGEIWVRKGTAAIWRWIWRPKQVLSLQWYSMSCEIDTIPHCGKLNVCFLHSICRWVKTKKKYLLGTEGPNSSPFKNYI